MAVDNIFAPLRISGSALSAEQLRMKAISQNIANANTTRTPEGGPYKRRTVVFSAVLYELTGDPDTRLPGVRAMMHTSTAPPQRVYNPDHPDADSTGHVLTPDVNVAGEMIDMIAAARSYEANLAAVRNFKTMVNKALAMAK